MRKPRNEAGEQLIHLNSDKKLLEDSTRVQPCVHRKNMFCFIVIRLWTFGLLRSFWCVLERQPRAVDFICCFCCGCITVMVLVAAVGAVWPWSGCLLCSCFGGCRCFARGGGCCSCFDSCCGVHPFPAVFRLEATCADSHDGMNGVFLEWSALYSYYSLCRDSCSHDMRPGLPVFTCSLVTFSKLKELLALGADSGSRTLAGAAPLHTALPRGCTVELRRKLLNLQIRNGLGDALEVMPSEEKVGKQDICANFRLAVSRVCLPLS